MAFKSLPPATHFLTPFLTSTPLHLSKTLKFHSSLLKIQTFGCRKLTTFSQGNRRLTISAVLPPLDLTEDNIHQVLIEARTELSQLFDESVGITGEVGLAELDGPFVKLSLKGRFWHKRSTVLARLSNYLMNRIPEILEVDIEDEKQLDDSPENF